MWTDNSNCFTVSVNFCRD